MVKTLPALIALREQLEEERPKALSGWGATGVAGLMPELARMHGLIEHTGVVSAMGLLAAERGLLAGERVGLQAMDPFLEARTAAIAYLGATGLLRGTMSEEEI